MAVKYLIEEEQLIGLIAFSIEEGVKLLSNVPESALHELSSKSAAEIVRKLKRVNSEVSNDRGN